MKNKRSLLFVLCGMLLIPLFSADTQVLAAKKGRPGHEAVVVKDKEPKNDEKSGEKPEETSGEKSDKEPKENQEELTSPIKQDKSAADKAENKEKKKKKKNKKKKNKKKSKGRNKKNRLKKNKKKKTKKGSKKGSKNKAKKGKKGNKNQNNKKSKKGNKNKKKDNKKVNEEKNLDLKEEEVGKIPETDKYKPVDNTDFSNAGIVNEQSGRSNSSSGKENKEKIIREYTVFGEYTDVDGKIRFKSGNAISLPESGYVGFVATGENTGIEDKLTWEGKDLESIKKGIKGNYVLTCITSENVVIGGKDYGKLKFLVYIIVE
ncbi:hypothetical protein [Catonella massiliensis]|uniref:Uncharacterized protein n=1 Tax=Catonella massiliensis TaxID=2799636 RepID=A0ABS1IXN0_9FIRM|nr:hypothetical protein [Catonella massiliensis]MBK5896649.1 hypothetical protein [Catonella massiliensis]